MARLAILAARAYGPSKAAANRLGELRTSGSSNKEKALSGQGGREAHLMHADVPCVYCMWRRGSELDGG